MDQGSFVLPIILAGLAVFEPVLVLLAVGHGGTVEGFGFCRPVGQIQFFRPKEFTSALPVFPRSSA
jgi:hypothetical protein